MPNNLNHIAIIMDGNRRWAKKNKLPISDGHKKGALVAEEIIKNAAQIGIKWLTLYAFSSENWKRCNNEVNDIMALLEFYLSNHAELFLKNNVKFRAIGDLSRLNSNIRNKIIHYESITSKADGLNLLVAINYGSKSEILNACKKIAREAISGNIDIENLEENNFVKFLYTANVPDPDLLIRTSGEQRISNFLLWQIAYTELYFTDILWPDFCLHDFEEAISSYNKRKRKYGAE
jgi:undecaprenyl diphosphate synthase